MLKKFLFIVVLFTLGYKYFSHTDNNLLLVSTSADNPPFEFVKNGKIEGFDIDLINFISKKLNKKVEIRNMDFFGLIPALTTKKTDIVIAALSKTENRAKQVDFSIPYFKASTALLTKNDSNIKSKKDLKGKKIGVQLGSTWEKIAKELEAEFSMEIKILTNNNTLFEELKNNNIDVMIMEEYQVQEFINKNPNFNLIELPDYTSEFVIAFPKDSPLVEEINRIIQESLGEIKQIEKNWFNRVN